VLQAVRSRAEPFFENGRRFVNLDPQVVSLEPDRDGDLLSDGVLRLDGTRVARCVDRGPDGEVIAPCLETPSPPVIPTPPSFVPKDETDPEVCRANLPTFAEMVARGYNAIAVDIVASAERSLRLGGGDGATEEKAFLVFNPALRDAAGSNPDPRFQDGIAYWYPGASDPCAEGVGRAPDGRPAFYLTVPDEDRNNRGATVIDLQSGRLSGGGFLESNVARPLPGEAGFSPLFNVPATWEELRDVTRATSGCDIADAYWSGATVYLTPEELGAGTKGPDVDADGCADTITLGGKTLTR
jgi:hypothetical protein